MIRVHAVPFVLFIRFKYCVGQEEERLWPETRQGEKPTQYCLPSRKNIGNNKTLIRQCRWVGWSAYMFPIILLYIKVAIPVPRFMCCLYFKPVLFVRNHFSLVMRKDTSSLLWTVNTDFCLCVYLQIVLKSSRYWSDFA